MTADTHSPAAGDHDPCLDAADSDRDEKSRLTAVQGLAALSLDALSSVAYGPEAIVIVLVAAGAAGLNYTLLSFGDEVVAVTVCYGDPDESAALAGFRAKWNTWHPNVPLVTLHSRRRSLAKPIVEYLRQLEADDGHHRLVVLIPEVQPARPWQWIMHNQRGRVLDRAIRRGTNDVVICRLRFRLTTWESSGELTAQARPR